MFFLDANVAIGVMTRRAPHFVQCIEAELAQGTPLLLSTVVLYDSHMTRARAISRR